VGGREHTYALALRWTGDRGSGTSDYRAYGRDHLLEASGKPTIVGSSDAAFRGDADRWNPEELLVAALAQCHMLWYLHLAATSGVVVCAYEDAPQGTMVEDDDGSGGGAFREVTLRPTVTVTDAAMVERALAIHAEIHAVCFIARSVSFPVRHEPHVIVAAGAR
jgi:organic hydroperoxide reductase OsmC/OhrA